MNISDALNVGDVVSAPINDELREQSIKAAAVTGVGVVLGAVVAPKRRRVTGALVGAGVGLLAATVLAVADVVQRDPLEYVDEYGFPLQTEPA